MITSVAKHGFPGRDASGLELSNSSYFSDLIPQRVETDHSLPPLLELERRTTFSLKGMATIQRALSPAARQAGWEIFPALPSKLEIDPENQTQGSHK